VKELNLTLFIGFVVGLFGGHIFQLTAEASVNTTNVGFSNPGYYEIVR
jgi:hypothetical protein